MSHDKHPRAVFRPFAKNAERAFSPLRTAVDIEKAIVFLDTNVLLSPYRTSSAALSEIKRIYTRLRSEKRLFIAAQVAREFAQNRPNLVAALYKQVLDARTININGQYNAAPVLHDLESHQRAIKALQAMKEALTSFRRSLDELAENVARWQHRDPVLDVYEQLFDASNVIETSLTSSEIEAIKRVRYAARVPPGYRDKGKDDGGVGDLEIWLTLLEVASNAGCDALLVTEDAKDDWFHQAGDKAIFPRHELALEFSELSSGRTFSLMNLSQLLNAMGAKREVIEEVKEQEQEQKIIAITNSEQAEYLVLSRLEEAGLGDKHFTLSFNTEHPHIDAVIIDPEDRRVAILIKSIRERAIFKHARERHQLYSRIPPPDEKKWTETAIISVALCESIEKYKEAHIDAYREAFISSYSSYTDILILLDERGRWITALNSSRHQILRRAFPTISR